MANTFVTSTELIDSYVQSTAMSPAEQFMALQDDNGNALVFSIGSDGTAGSGGTFYVTQETGNPAQQPASGTMAPSSALGWQQIDLSTAVINSQFSGGVCTNFTVAQNLENSSIGMAMVVTANGSDNLLLCLGNSSSDLSWLQNPAWTFYEYDNPDVPAPSPLSVANVFIREVEMGSGSTTQISQFIVADLDVAGLVSRYFVNVDPPVGQSYNWQTNFLSDVSVTGYLSCIGRPGNQPIDGIYTGGQIGSDAQLFFTPVYDYWGSSSAAVYDLLLPGSNTIPQSMAAFRNGCSDNSTDLLVTDTDGNLYWFASTNQTGSGPQTPVAAQIYSNSYLANVTNLSALLVGGTLTIWGLNSDNIVFYLTTSYFYGQSASDFVFVNPPLPLLTQANLVSAFTNVTTNCNTIFAANNGGFYQLQKSPATSLWMTSQITLPVNPSQSSVITFSSYTTMVQLVDENTQPIANSPVQISVNSPASYYINGIYTNLSTDPITVYTNNTGTVTLVQPVSGLHCSQLVISGTDSGTTAVSINPMEITLSKFSQINAPDTLSSAQVVSYNGSTTPQNSNLVPTGTSSDDLATAATAIGHLSKAGANPDFFALPRTSVRRTLPELVADSSGGIFCDIGDLFKWLENAIEFTVKILESDVKGFFNFVATIAGEVYTAVLNSLESVVNSITWVLNQIGTAIEDVINFLSYIFDWQNIVTTKEVLYNLITLFVQNGITELSTIQSEFNKAIGSVERAINSWAGISWQGISSQGSLPVSNGSVPAQNSSVATTSIANHFQNNAGNASVTSSPIGFTTEIENLLEILLSAANTEASILVNAVTDIQNLMSNFQTAPLTTTLEGLVAILADTALSSFQDIGDALFNLLISAAEYFASVLESSMYIPVISEILAAVGETTPSALDIICWVVAIPVTVIYELANDGAPPFAPGTTDTNFLTSPDTTWAQLISAFSDGGSNASARALAAQEKGKPVEMFSLNLSPEVKLAIFTSMHSISAVASLINAVLSPSAAVLPAVGNPFSTAAAVTSFVSAATDGIANAFVPVDPITNSWWSDSNLALTALRVECLILFSGFFWGAKYSDEIRKVGGDVDALFTLAQLACTIDHFVELNSLSGSDDKAIAIMEECGNIVGYLGRCLVCVIYNTDDNPPVVLVCSVAYVVTFVVYTGLQIAEVIVYIEDSGSSTANARIAN